MASAQAVVVSASHTTVELAKFKHQWSIDNFSNHLDWCNSGDAITSSEFGSVDGSQKFRMRLFPVGHSEDVVGYSSLELEILSSPYNQQRVVVTFYVCSEEGLPGFEVTSHSDMDNQTRRCLVSRLTNHKLLKNHAQSYLPGDVLTVGVDVTTLGRFINSNVNPDFHDSTNNELSGQPGTLGHDWAVFHESRSSTDCVLKVQSENISCHKAVLQARSPVFYVMFQHDTREKHINEVTIDDCTPDAIKALVQFMYTGKCSRLDELAGEVIVAADKYCVSLLKQECERHLCQGLTVDNICERLRIADLFNANLLRAKTLNFIDQNHQRLFSSPQWKAFEQRNAMVAASALKDVFQKLKV